MQIVANNKKAYYDYFIEETIEAGIVLVGTEVKSIQEGACSMKDGYIRIDGNEVSVIGMHIPVYSNGNIFNHDPDRVKKLLLNKAEIRKLRQKTEQAGYTLVPTKVYFNDKHLVKVEVGVAKGKKNYDKRESIKQRDVNRQIARGDY